MGGHMGVGMLFLFLSLPLLSYRISPIATFCSILPLLGFFYMTYDLATDYSWLQKEQYGVIRQILDNEERERKRREKEIQALLSPRITKEQIARERQWLP